MQLLYSLELLLLLASLAAAQSTSACANQAVVDLCVSSTSAIAQNCASTDYGCLCTSYNAVLTCFNSCLNDPRRDSAVSQMASSCANASIYSSSTSALSSAPATASPSTTGTGTGMGMGTKTAVQSSTGTGSTTSTAGTAAKTNSAVGGKRVGAKGVVLGAVAVLGALL